MPETPGPNNFPATIVDMRDVYGLASEPSMQTSVRPSSNLVSSNADSSRQSKSSSSSSFSFSRLLRKRKRVSSESPISVPTDTPSSSRRSSIDSQETLTTPNSNSSVSKVTSAPRDYEAAFGALSSSYGFGEHNSTSVPVLPYTTSTSSRTTSHRKTGHGSSSSSSKLFSQTDAGAEARFMYATTR